MGAQSPAAPGAETAPKAAATLDELRAQYDALPDKRTGDGAALRRAIAEAEDREAASLPDGARVTTTTRTVTPKRSVSLTQAQREHAAFVEQMRAQVPTEEGWYTCGLQGYGDLPPPRHWVDYGGIHFPVECADENPTVKNDTIEFNQRRKGQRVYLDEEDLRRFREVIGSKIVRVRSIQTGRTVILPARSPAARRRLKGDTPLECFLYMTPADEPAPVDYTTPGQSKEQHATPLFPAFQQRKV